MASTKLTRTFSADSNRKKFTVSVWVKKSQNASVKPIWGGEISTGYVWFNMGSTIYFQQNPSSTIEFNSTAKFRDSGAWYHVVQQVDTAQATNTNRMKFWVNGEQITNWATSTYPSQDEEIKFQSAAYPLRIGEFGNSYWDGSMSHFHWCDGYAYEASDFGSTDATTGEWKIKTSPNVSYGTNGFFILKDGNSVTDESPNTNNFTVSAGTLTKTEDNPSNNFATLNPLYRKPQTNPSELTNGNTGVIGGSAHRADVPTIAVNSGKWYMEAKAISGNTTKWWWGLSKVSVAEEKQSLANTDNFIYGDTSGTQGVYNNNLKVDGSTAISSIFGGAVAANDIVMIAVDLDNQKVWYGLNGTWNNGSASQSTTINLSYPDSTALTANEYYYIGVGNENTKWHTNYGNGYFGTTAVSSAGTNASGIGIFEYDVPTGFTALSTKGLNE
tara:strand:+ start:69 stop:1394 length:1326 start_codon:yes stop_codon:yes gene_type:complete